MQPQPLGSIAGSLGAPVKSQSSCLKFAMTSEGCKTRKTMLSKQCFSLQVQGTDAGGVKADGQNFHHWEPQNASGPKHKWQMPVREFAVVGIRHFKFGIRHKLQTVACIRGTIRTSAVRLGGTSTPTSTFCTERSNHGSPTSACCRKNQTEDVAT